MAVPSYNGDIATATTDCRLQSIKMLNFIDYNRQTTPLPAQTARLHLLLGVVIFILLRKAEITDTIRVLYFRLRIENINNLWIFCALFPLWIALAYRSNSEGTRPYACPFLPIFFLAIQHTFCYDTNIGQGRTSWQGTARATQIKRPAQKVRLFPQNNSRNSAHLPRQRHTRRIYQKNGRWNHEYHGIYVWRRE